MPILELFSIHETNPYANIKQNMHTQTSNTNFRRFCPFSITPGKRAQKANIYNSNNQQCHHHPSQPCTLNARPTLLPHKLLSHHEEQSWTSPPHYQSLRPWLSLQQQRQPRWSCSAWWWRSCWDPRKWTADWTAPGYCTRLQCHLTTEKLFVENYR